MWNRILQSWELIRISFGIIHNDKTLLLFPLFAGLASCLLFAAQLYLISLDPMWPHALQGFKELSKEQERHLETLLAVHGIIAMYLNYFLITFFDVALMSCAVRSAKGEDTTFGQGVAESSSRIGGIFVWTLIVGTFSLIIGMLRGDSKKQSLLVSVLRNLLADISEIAFALAKFLALPIMVVERKPAFTALSESAQRIKQTWGDQVIGHFSFGGVSFLISLPAWIAIVAGCVFFKDNMVLALWLIGGSILWIFLVSLVIAAAKSIFQIAVYFRVVHDQTFGTFDKYYIESSFIQGANRIR